MKRAVTLIALLAVISLGVIGCKPKAAEKKPGGGEMAPVMEPDMKAADPMADMKAADPMAGTMAADPMAGTMAADPMAGKKADGIAPFGIKECDDYIRIWTCYLHKLPMAQQGPTKDVFMKSLTTWRKMASGPAKSSLGMTCKAAYDGWKKAIAKQPKFASCFGK